MYRLWLIFTQTVTVSLAVFFVISTLRPEWLAEPPGQEKQVVALREHLERETGLLVFACRDEAGRHTASAAFPLHEDEAARLIAACGRDRSETIRTADGGFFSLIAVPELRCTVLAVTAPGMPAVAGVWPA